MAGGKTTGVAVKGLVVHEGKALLLKRSDYDPFGAGQYEFPGGRLEFGEDLEAALKREIMEEAGLPVTVERLLYADGFLKHERRHVVVLTWLCKAQSDKVTLSNEHTAFVWADKARMKTLLTPFIARDCERFGVYELPELK
ncbi:MAG: NUDIX domain-containing protein [Clostridiaceae bacterium]|nr:NUDIX domain-containing protein [Eubacteriales bacterium]